MERHRMDLMESHLGRIQMETHRIGLMESHSGRIQMETQNRSHGVTFRQDTNRERKQISWSRIHVGYKQRHKMDLMESHSGRIQMETHKIDLMESHSGRIQIGFRWRHRIDLMESHSGRIQIEKENRSHGVASMQDTNRDTKWISWSHIQVGFRWRHTKKDLMELHSARIQVDRQRMDRVELHSFRQDADGDTEWISWSHIQVPSSVKCLQILALDIKKRQFQESHL